MQTPLYTVQKELGGRFVDFAGWDMPVQFPGVIDEHTAVRSAVGLFDVSHMGEVRLTGKDAVKFADHLVTQHVALLAVGRAVYCVMCNADGGIVDDLIVYREADAVLLVINSATTVKDLAHIRERATGFDVHVEDVSASYALIAVQGPKSDALLEKVVNRVPDARFSFVDTQSKDGSKIRVARTGYTGERGVEIFVAPAQAEKLFRKLLHEGEALGCKPCGLGARDSLRLEKKMPLYGSDIDDTTSPLEAQLGWAVKLDKDFFGRASLLAQKEKGVSKKWVGFVMQDRTIPRHGYQVHVHSERVGEVTSGTMSPSLKIGIGCAYLPVALCAIGSDLQIIVRGQAHAARVVKTPFL